MSKRKRTSRTSKVRKRTKKATGMKRKYDSILMAHRPPKRTKKNSSASMQPKSRRNPSRIPTAKQMEIQIYKPPTPAKQDKSRLVKAKKTLGKAKVIAKDTGEVIKWTAKKADKVGGLASQVAPGLNMAAAGSENPFVIGAAAFVDGIAGIYQSYHGIDNMMKRTHKTITQGQIPNEKSLTSTGKYQKLMQKPEDEDQDTLMLMDVPFEDITPPPTETTRGPPYRYVIGDDPMPYG